MHEFNFNKVVFYSIEDMAGSRQLKKGEEILRRPTLSEYTNINDVLELYNIKKYIDNELYLVDWTPEDIANFKQKVSEYDKIIGQFMSKINNSNVIQLYEETYREYIASFWELVNNQSIFKRISKVNLNIILTKEPYLIRIILSHKRIVDHYNNELRSFLLTYSESAEILLSIYEVIDDFRKNQKFLPKSLSVEDKEAIISNYLESDNTNLNYIGLIQNVRDKNDFKISNKTRLKAKRLEKSETEKFFTEKGGTHYEISISYPLNATKIKYVKADNLNLKYFYSIDFIKQNNNPYSLYLNFKFLFEFVDIQNRVSLVNKKTQMGVMERIIGVRSQNEYRTGFVFNSSEKTSQLQIFSYNLIVKELNNSLEDILHHVFTSEFQEKYGFADNAHFSIPSSTSSSFEKVRLLAPEFESILKQFKLYVEDGEIDFELLEISSTPSAIKDIPSLNTDKYIYLNENNKEMVGCSYLFFSDQTLLTYVEPFKEKQFNCFFDLLANEQVNFNNYEEHQKLELNYLIEKGYISINENGIIQITNLERVLILKDLYINEVASYYHYPINLQKEVQQMISEGIVLFESSLFTKPEQSYFNYFLNKSEFTNGLDLRNSYLHGTQARPHETKTHEYAYFTYLRLLFMTLLKIEDDLFISQMIKNRQ